MKKLLFLAAVATAAMFTACDPAAEEGGEDGKTPVEEEVTKVYSFTASTYAMTATATVELELFDEEGAALVAEEEITIPVSVAANDEGTAVEGENFAFDGDAAIVIPVGKSSGKVNLKIVGDVVAEKNVFFIKADVEDDATFVAGRYNEAKVIILGSVAEKLLGTWKMSQFVTDKAAMDGAWGGMISFEAEEFPEFNAEDTITIGADFQTAFVSDFKYYFAEQSDMVFGEEMEMTVGMGDRIKLQQITLNNINRYFSASEKSEDDEAIIGVRLLDDGKLDVYIIDYYSKSFAPDFPDWMMYSDTKPVATMGGVFLNFVMEKVTE